MISGVAQDTLHLSFLDQNTTRCYIQTLQVFPFPDDSQADAAVETLANALWVTLTKLPFLAGTLGPADPETGKLSLRYPTEILDVQQAGLFASKKLAYPDEWPHEYAQLKRDGMPPSVFSGETFCPHVLRDQQLEIPPFAEGHMLLRRPAPVLAVQAFFMRGGLVLSIYIHHSVVDCSGMNNFWKHFSDSVRHRRGIHTSSGARVPNQSSLRSQLDARVPVYKIAPLADAFVREKFEFQQTLPCDSSCSAKVFVFSAARIRAFRDKLRQVVPNDTPLTICNVLSALVWIHVTRARSTHLIPSGYSDSSIGIAVDSRRRLQPPVSEEYMGVMAIFAKATLPISDFLAEERVTESTILSTALEISRTISKVDDAWVMRQLAFFRSKSRIQYTEPALKFRFGPDIYITSWMNFGAEHKWNIPGTTSEMPEFIRRTTDRKSDGGIIIYPRRRTLIDGQEAPYEILVRLATEDMQRLEGEEGGLRYWAERVVE